MNLGLSGRLTAATITSPLTPLFLIAAIAVGLLALVTIPREEEPQISVPMVDIMVRADGLSAAGRGRAGRQAAGGHRQERQRRRARLHLGRRQPGDGHRPLQGRHRSRTTPIVRIHEKIRANYDRIPAGIPEPLIWRAGINDVPAVVLTLSPKPGAAGHWTDQALYEIAGKLRTEIAKVDNVGLTFIVGGRPEEIRVEPDPARLALHGVSLGALIGRGPPGRPRFPGRPGPRRRPGRAR